MTKTFLALLNEADISEETVAEKPEKPNEPKTPKKDPVQVVSPTPSSSVPGLHYNIQIHLPPTKDIEVYNAIFKSLREHLISE